MKEDLNKKHRVFDDILTPKEITDAGFVYLLYPNFITDKTNKIYDSKDFETNKEIYPLASRTFKLKCKYDHDWNDEQKAFAKKLIIHELKLMNIVFVHKVSLTPIVYDADNFSYNIGVLVRGSKNKT